MRGVCWLFLMTSLLRRALPARVVSQALRMVATGADGGAGRRRGLSSFREAVHRAAKLSEVIADSGVHVQASGGKIMARCPFHGDGTERTPSMSINDEKGVYYCFACEASGNAVTFLEHHEGMATGEALAELARRYDVEGADAIDTQELGAGGWPAAPPLTPEHQALVAANEAAAAAFQQARRARALPGSDAALCAEQMRSRGIDNALAERFGLGFAAGGKVLTKYLASQPNVSRTACVQAGLIIDTGGESYDRFRARLMIPIHDAHGRVIAFGGRALKPPEPGREALYPK